MNGLVFHVKNKAYWLHAILYHSLPIFFVNFALDLQIVCADQRQMNWSLSQIVGILKLSMQIIKIETNSALIEKQKNKKNK